MRNRIFQRRSVSVKVTIIIFVLVFPLNLLAIYQNQIATDTMLRQGEMALKNMADIQMKELEGRAEDLQFLLSYFNLQDTDCIRMIQQPEDEFRYKSALYRFYHTLKTMAGMMGSGDGYFYFMHQKEDILYYNLNHHGEFDPSMDEFIQKYGRSPDYAGWNFVELPTGRYYVLVRNLKDISYGGWINLNDIEDKVLEELGSEEYQVLFSKNQIEKSRKRWVEAEAGQPGLRLSISVEKETLLGSLSRFQSLNRMISFFYLVLIPILYLILRRMLFIPYSRAEQDLMKLKLESYEYELSRQKTELENLQLQIRPHFLQNTFNLIFSLAQKNEISEVQGAILYLSDYFRHIFRSTKEVVLFQKEWKLIEEYIKIANIRYGGGVFIVYQIDPEIAQVRVPPLLLHNFVENAVKHGKKEGELLEIRLEGYYQDHQVIFIISDNGNGMTKEILSKSQKIVSGFSNVWGESSHIGLQNSVKRLKCIYGEETSVWIESEEGQGTSIIVTIPYNLEEKDESVDCK